MANRPPLQAGKRTGRAKTASSHGSDSKAAEIGLRELLAFMLSECEPTEHPGLMVIATSVVEEIREGAATFGLPGALAGRGTFN